MTGGTGSYDDRGLIPRTLSYIFNECKQRSENIKVNISYLQIYQSYGYDLLAVENVTKKLEDLPKVEPREGANGELQLNNLQSFHCNTEEDALNYLFIGDTNRVVSKTPKNDESTRSHCIFIINLETSKPGSDIKTVASVHLVDLSGS
jgi:kinesin family protein 6/9